MRTVSSDMIELQNGLELQYKTLDDPKVKFTANGIG